MLARARRGVERVRRIARRLGWRWVPALLALMAVAAIGYLVRRVLALQAETATLHVVDRIPLENDLIRTLAYILAGLVVLVGLWLTWRRIELAQEGQITERFTRAIEQLGSDKLQVRLGGIYALERIARDSERDHWPIMEVLTAFVRESAPWRADQPAGEERAPEEEAPPLRPTTDVQAVLTVIGRRERTSGKGETEHLDLRRTDLRGADLRRANLEEANLYGAHLELASLMDARLEWAILNNVHLEGADLSDAHLELIRLRNARLERAVLVAAHLENAYLGGAYLERARLWDARLERAWLIGAHLEGAELTGAYLERANLGGAHLEGADLRGATGLTPEQVASAHIDTDTRLPDYLRATAEGEDS